MFKIEEMPIVESPQPPDREPDKTSENIQKTSPQVDNEEYEEAKLRLQEMEEINRLTLEQLDKEEKSQPVSLDQNFLLNCNCNTLMKCATYVT